MMSSKSRKDTAINFFKITLLTVTLIVATNVQAVDPIYTPLFSNKAVKGYDTVAYFVESRPVKGKDEYTTSYMGAKWLFSSQENLDLFLSEPIKYAPQYGGYCAYAVSQNYTASIQPELFTIYQGKLYLNYSVSVNTKWTENKISFIKAADQYWPKILSK
jgi:YHS domain-containing protein